MKTVLQEGSSAVLKFDKGEEVVAVLTAFLKQQQIGGCFFTGLGAANLVELGYYDIQSRAYVKKTVSEDLEIVAFSGNGSIKDGEHLVHAHGCFGKTDLSTISGHVFKMLVSITFELVLTKFTSPLRREFNQDIGLNLLN